MFYAKDKLQHDKYATEVFVYLYAILFLSSKPIILTMLERICRHSFSKLFYLLVQFPAIKLW